MATVYLICFFVGIVFVVVSAVMSGVFGGGESGAAGKEISAGGHEIEAGSHEIEAGGHDVDVGGHDIDVSSPEGDYDTDVGGHEAAITDATPGLSPLSPTVLSVFVTSFGGCGFLANLVFPQPYIHVPIAALSGLGLGLATFILFNKLFSAISATSGYTLSELVGLPARVLVTIPEKGVGEVSFIAGGARMSGAARSDEGKAHPANSGVIITRVAGGTVYVRESPDEKFARLTRKKDKKQKEQNG